MSTPLLNCRVGLFSVPFAACLLTLTGLVTLHAQDFAAGVRWETDPNAAMARAEREQRPLFFHFVGSGDPSAQQMEREVFVQPQIASYLNANFVMVKVNASENAALAQKFSVKEIPTDLIMKPNGQLIHRRTGVITADRFSGYLSYLQTLIQPHSPVNTGSPVPPPTHTIPGPLAGANPAGSPPPSPMSPPAGTMPTPREATTVPDPFALQSLLGTQQPVARTDTISPAPGNNPLRIDDPAVRPTIEQGANPSQNYTNGLTTAPLLTSTVPAISVTLAGEPAPPKMTVEVPLALEGCCPVTLCTEERWIPGNPVYCLLYQGHIFRFATVETLTTFAKNPANFVPIAMGEDIVLMVDRNKRVNGNRDFGAYYQGRVFLFSSQESFNSFAARPSYYTEIALKYEMARKEQSMPLVY